MDPVTKMIAVVCIGLAGVIACHQGKRGEWGLLDVIGFALLLAGWLLIH